MHFNGAPILGLAAIAAVAVASPLDPTAFGIENGVSLVEARSITTDRELSTRSFEDEAGLAPRSLAHKALQPRVPPMHGVARAYLTEMNPLAEPALKGAAINHIGAHHGVKDAVKDEERSAKALKSAKIALQKAAPHEKAEKQKEVEAAASRLRESSEAKAAAHREAAEAAERYAAYLEEPRPASVWPSSP